MAKVTELSEQVKRLEVAIESADRQLGLVLDSRSEYGYAASVCLAARRRLRAGLKDCGLLEPEPPAEPTLNQKTDIVEQIKWYRKKIKTELPKPPNQLRRRIENTIADLDCLLNSDSVTDDTAYINNLARHPGAAIPRVTTLIDYASRYQVELAVANDMHACHLVDEDALRGWLRRAGRLLADKYPGTLVAACNALGIRQSYKNWFAGKLCSPRLDVFITVAITLGYRVYWWAPWWSVEARAHAFETALPRRGVTQNMKG